MISLERSSEGEGGFTDIPNSREPVSNGQIVPVTVRFRLLPFGIGDSADFLMLAHDLRSCFQVVSAPSGELGFVKSCFSPNSLYGESVVRFSLKAVDLCDFSSRADRASFRQVAETGYLPAARYEWTLEESMHSRETPTRAFKAAAAVFAPPPSDAPQRGPW